MGPRPRCVHGLPGAPRAREGDEASFARSDEAALARPWPALARIVSAALVLAASIRAAGSPRGGRHATRAPHAAGPHRRCSAGARSAPAGPGYTARAGDTAGPSTAGSDDITATAATTGLAGRARAAAAGQTRIRVRTGAARGPLAVGSPGRARCVRAAPAALAVIASRVVAPGGPSPTGCSTRFGARFTRPSNEAGVAPREHEHEREREGRAQQRCGQPRNGNGI